MSIIDGKPFIATKEHCKAPWSGGEGGRYFRCYFCGYKFIVGDIARMQYTNNVKGASGNPLVCDKCDGPKEELVNKWKAMHEEAKGRMWWFCRYQ